MRVLAACSLGGAGHLRPLLEFVEASSAGNECVLAGPRALEAMATESRFTFWPCDEPPEVEVAAIRDQLALATADVAAALGNRDLCGRLATTAMLPRMAQLFEEWQPELVLRDPCEYASAVLALRAGTPAAQVAISFADVEVGSIRIASPALESHQRGLTDSLVEQPYLTRFPESIDPSSFPRTIRYRVTPQVQKRELSDQRRL